MAWPNPGTWLNVHSVVHTTMFQWCHDKDKSLTLLCLANQSGVSPDLLADFLHLDSIQNPDIIN